MYPNKSSSKQPLTKSALGSLLLSDKGPKSPSRSTLVSPILQQVGKLAAGVANVSTEIPVSGSATGTQLFKFSMLNIYVMYVKTFYFLVRILE